jgi:hypothetical protein
MRSIQDLPEQCTVEEAAVLLAEVAADLALTRDVPSVRTLRLWRAKHLLSPGSRRMTRKNVLEALVIVRLGVEGMGTAAAAERAREWDDARLLRFLTGGPGMPASVAPGTPPEITLRLLALGLLALFRAVTERDAIVGHMDAQQRNTPATLRRAMALLGRHYFEEGQPDVTASVHALIRCAMTPLEEWAPIALRQLPNVADLVLVDPDYVVPTEDCQLIAEEAEGATPDDLVERHLHDQLMESLNRLSGNADRAYTAVREFIGRHPMATRPELRLLTHEDPEWPDEAIAFIQSVYMAVHRGSVAGTGISRCRFCQGLIDRDGRCTLRACREEHSPSESGERVAVEHAFAARREVLMYWTEPALAELKLYDALLGRGLHAELYPHRDRCDVALNEQVGIDVKDYADPVRLARKLNRGIGGLAYYPRAILAVADRRARTAGYLDRLREQLTPSTRRRLEVLSVQETIRALAGSTTTARKHRAR